jgi:hypothetical protein
MSAPPELMEVAEAVAKELGLAAPAFCGNTVLPATLDAFRDYGRDLGTVLGRRQSPWYAPASDNSEGQKQSSAAVRQR